MYSLINIHHVLFIKNVDKVLQNLMPMLRSVHISCLGEMYAPYEEVVLLDIYSTSIHIRDCLGSLTTDLTPYQLLKLKT